MIKELRCDECHNTFTNETAICLHQDCWCDLHDAVIERDTLHKQLAIAVEAMERGKSVADSNNDGVTYDILNNALAEIANINLQNTVEIANNTKGVEIRNAE